MKGVGVIAIIITIAILIGGVAYIKASRFNDKDYTIKITKTERVEGSGYLVFGEDENGKGYVFANKDCFTRMKFNSSDIYGQLKKGKTYTVTTIGYRSHFFSGYKNILKIKEVK